MADGAADQVTFAVTGATGFLGRRLLVRLLHQEPNAQLIAMGRSNDPQEPEAKAFIASQVPNGVGRVQWLACDITKPMLGLNDADVAALARTRELNILHLAALYDLAVAEGPSKALNLDGAIHAYDLALAIRRHPEHEGRPVRFCHTATLAVAGTYDGEFGETGEELALAQGKHTDWYSRHKHASEVALHERERPDEVPLMIVRPGIAVGDSDTGAIEKLDGPYAILEYVRWPVFSHLAPAGSDDALWIVPGDFVVRAMSELGATPEAYGRTFNLLYPPGQAPIWSELVRCTYRMLRSEEYAGRGLRRLRAWIKYGWYLPLPVRWIVRWLNLPILGGGFQRLFRAMGVAPEALHYAVDNPQYVVENYQRMGVDPPSPWREVWRNCLLYYRDHRDAMLEGATIAHQKDTP